ncbi:hypothetical protein J3B02_003216 [Coemansia erecta]|nr:hypothetical protein J3B02_003216 [Coemansia erecta]
MRSTEVLAHVAKLAQIRIICNEGGLEDYNALGIPDIMLNASAVFKTSMTTVPSNVLLDARYHNDAPQNLTYQLISMATRPEIVKALRLHIIYMGKKKKLGEVFRFNQLDPVERDDDATRTRLNIQFVEPSRSDYFSLSSNSLTARESSGFSLGMSIESDSIYDPAAIMDPIMITGPRHIGKSHIMFNLAARMAADPGVVVMYISDASDLLVNTESDMRCKYTQFVDYISCAFCDYEEINLEINKWHFGTEMGSAVSKMRDATRVLLQRVRKLCEDYKDAGHRSKPTQGITPIIFIDRYELIADANPFDTIVTVVDLARTFGFLVFLSTSDPASYQINPPSFISQCVISTPMTPKEARRLAVAIAGNLRISKQDANRIFEAADSHPIDIAGILQSCQMYAINLTTDAIKRVIKDHRYHRQGRLVAMHSEFVQKIMDAELKQIEPQKIKKIGAARKTIDTDMPQLLQKRRDIMRTPFMLYHWIDFRPGTLFDPQFLLKDRSHMRDKDRNNGIRCVPYSAIQAMYKYHFQGSVHEQFSWLLDEAKYSFEIDQPVRGRFFDLVVLETEQLNLTLTHPLTDLQWTETLHFRALTTHNYFDIDDDYGDPGDCLYFTDAVNYVANYIAINRKIAPSPHRIAVSGMSTMIYFPNLTFQNKPQQQRQQQQQQTDDDASWVDQALSANTSFAGTFIACVTRDNIFSDEGTYQRCEYRLTWIAWIKRYWVDVD